ncbi:hypothetical protein L1049_011261 [Liquidambar formosana]|uniref:FMR1-interacting protein 1 conserved domain-containing protein n=1 Tax=Liquidambar formosana TaxID=63359 RepID=A0AAP0RRW5_LIQFO
MRPLFSSFPHQIQTEAPRASATQPQVMPSNPCIGNSSNSLPNPLQVQSQIGIMNPQFSIPFYDHNTHLNNGHAVAMNNMPPSVTPPGFNMNFPNLLLPLQNNHLGMPHLGSTAVASHPGQGQVGFAPHHMNTLMTFPMHKPFCNLAQNLNQFNQSQPPGQLFAHNSPNIPQNFNQNMGALNGQFCWQNPMQNMNQLVPVQMSNPTQVGPYNVPSCSHQMLGCPNQVAQAMGPQNPAFIANTQFGLVHSGEVGQHVNQNQQQWVQPSMDVNAWKQSPIATQQVQGNPSTSIISHSAQTQQTQKNFQPSVFTSSQGNHVKDGGNNISNSNWKNSMSKNFMANPKRETSHWGFQKSQFRHMKNTKRKYGGFNENGGKGVGNDGAGKSGLVYSAYGARVQQKRSLSLNYTEQEIQHWRDERRKNYPSRANVDKKLAEKLTNSKVIDREAKLRRQQLKEILAKQAELGVPVAELPSYYLLDSEDKVQGREENERALTKKERFQNKYKKRGRHGGKDRFAKKQKLEEKDSSNMAFLNSRKPTLLQKLLSADIRRDKSHLLQVFRFVVMNSFFKDGPEKPLKFPVVIVKESGCEGELVEEKTSFMGKGASKAADKTLVEEFHGKDDDDNNENDAHIEEKAYLASGEGTIREIIENLEEDEEEGEIID